MLIKTVIYVELEDTFKEVFYFDSPYFMLDGFPATIVGSKSSGATHVDVVHTIKWKGDYVPYSMKDLIYLKKQGRLK